jgi:hypothetical protein
MTKQYKNSSTTWVRRHWLAVAAVLVAPVSLQAQEGDEPKTWDGLIQVEQSEVYSAFINPDADFSVFSRVAVLEPHVAFRSNWRRDVNRSRTRNVRASDAERIKEDVSALLKEVFVERLEAAGYPVVNVADEDVLILRPAIIDLDVVAPETRQTGRSRTYTASTGAATVFMELFDSLSGDLLGRALDRQSAGQSRTIATVANRVTNRADARRVFAGWADQLIDFLDRHYVKADMAE